MKVYTVLLCVVSMICMSQSQVLGRPGGDWWGGRRPPWCGPQIFCFVNPCQVRTCPRVPGAVCYNDDPCDRACTGHFYYRGWRVPDAICDWGRD